MEAIIFGYKLQLEDGKEANLFWGAEKVAGVILKGNNLKVSFIADVNHTALGGAFSFSIKSGTQFSYDIVSRTGNYTGQFSIIVFNNTINGITPSISQSGELLFGIAINDVLNKVIYDQTINNYFQYYGTISLNNVIDKIRTTAFTLELGKQGVDLFVAPDQYYKIGDRINIKTGPLGGSEALEFGQTMPIDRIRLHGTGGSVLFVIPQYKYVPVFPDVLSVNQDMITNKSELQIKYQFALANGIFSFEKIPGQKGMISWVSPLFSDERPLLVMPNLSDSNSYPTALKTATDKFGLVFREGLFSLFDPTPVNRFEKTIRGLSVAEVTDATLHELAFETIDWERKERQLYGIKLKSSNTTEALVSPFWLPANGIVVVQESSPSNIYSILKGGWLESKNKSLTTLLKCSLKAEAVDLGGEDIYHVMTIELDAADWDLYSQYEERESYSMGGVAANGVYNIDSRKFTTQHTGPLVLPATDYLLGGANIADPAGKSGTKIPEKIQEKIKKLNNAFSNFSADAVGQEHIQGFLRDYNGSTRNISVDTIFQYPPSKANTINDTLSIPIQLKPAVVDFKHGNVRHLPAATGIPLTTVVVNRMDPVSAQRLADQLHHLWNDHLLLAESASDAGLRNAAVAIHKVRIYLENLSSEQNNATLRVQTRNGVYYRLKLNTLAPSPENKLALLHRVKTLVKGNFNAIPGLGKRLKTVQQQVEDLTIAAFTTLWDQGWNKLTTEEDKIIYALLDTVYKQFDRSVINKLLEILLSTQTALDEIRLQVKIIFDYLKLTPTEIEAFKNKVEEEVTTVLSNVIQGLDPYVEQLREIWDNATAGCNDVPMSEMKALYGERFGVNTINGILKDLKSGNSSIEQNAKRVINCLERKLKQEIKNKLLAEWNQLAAKPWNDIEVWLSETFEAYQEDIWNFYSFILKVEATKSKLEGYLVLVRKASKVKNATELIALRGEPGFKELYDEASTIIQKEYGDELQRLQVITQAKFEELVNKHWEKILFVADAVEKLIDEYNFWKDIIPKLKEAIEDLKFTITGFITGLNDDNKRRAMLRILVLYLLEKYQVNISLPDLRIDPPQYIIYSKHLSFNTSPAFKKQMEDLLKKLHLQQLVLCKLGSGKQWDHSFSESSVYILKLGNDMNLPAILREVNSSNKKPGLKYGPFNDEKPSNSADSPLEELIKDLHPDMLDAGWRGIFIYKPFADIRNDALLRDLVGKSSLQMAYSAIGGTSSGSSAGQLDVSFNIYARVKENAEKMDMELGSGDNRPDSELTLVKFDALIKNTTLESGEALLRLDFRNVFSKEYPKDAEHIMIRGSLPSKIEGVDTPRDFEFGVTFHPEKELKDLPGFMDSLQLRGIKATRQAGRSVLEIDAILNFKEFDVVVKVKKLALKNFYIILPSSDNGTENPAGKPRGVNFDIGAVEFIIDAPRPINFSGIELLPKGIGYIKSYVGKLADDFDAPVIWIANRPSKDNSIMYFKLDVQMGKLPSLGGVNAKDLRLEGVIGIKVKNSVPNGKPFFGLTGLSAKEISIDLFRFISIYINELLVRNAKIGVAPNETKVTFIGAKKIDLKILDWSPLGKNADFSLAFFHNDPKDAVEAGKSPRTGMIAAYSNKNGTDIGIIKLYWILLANNLQFDPKLLNGLLSPPNVDASPVNEIMNRVFKGIQDDSQTSFKDISFTSSTSWLFGASFSIAGILDRCSFVLHDQYYYGVMLSSTELWFKELFGVDTLSLAYIPGKTKQLDRFRIEMGLPLLDLLGPLQAGLVALEYGLNRDFLIDFGFPWKDGNHYLWHRTFSFAAGIYETRFGFYFEKRTDITPDSSKSITIGAGVAFSYGYKVGARNPVAWAEAGISVTVILMGSVTFKFANGGSAITQLKGTLEKIEVIGVIGIYAYARGGINYWVLSAEIRAEVVAALAGHLIYMPKGNSSLTFAATLSVRYSASCRVRCGFTSFTFRVSGSLGYGVHGRIGLN